MESENEKITRVDIETTMKSAYIDYAMSVIVSRALPDARDGLKPVQRRILYSMNETGATYAAATRKSARIVGDVMGKYHPHGDSSIYMALVRMAQPWAMRYCLVDGQGNFGSIDGDSPAAMRYTEARLKKLSNEMVADIEKDTVDMMPTYDNDNDEPTVLPARIPNLLINGSAGIAVGMATNMPTHNLREVMNGCIAYIDNPQIEIEELMQHIPAPDFPLGGIIYGYKGVREAYTTGRGSIILRADTTIEEDKRGRTMIVATSVPYNVNKSEMIKRQAQLVTEKKIEGITDIRDESDKDGVRVVYYLRHDVVPNVILNKLFQLSELQSSFAVNNIALVKGRPQLLTLKDLVANFIEHREDVVTRRTRFDMAAAEKRAHILQGFLKALDIIDQIIALIRASKTVEEARQGLVDQYQFSELQAAAIVEMRLRQLTGLERENLQNEYDELIRFIERCKEILANHDVLMSVIKEELIEIRDKYGDDRRSRIEYDAANFRMEDTIADDKVVITISHRGYIKRTLLAEYHAQHRGGTGSKGSALRGEDFVEHIFTCTNHNYILFFTEKGLCYWRRAFEIPEGGKDSKGRPIVNIIDIASDDKVKAYINVLNLKDDDYLDNNSIVLTTKSGIVKKTSLKAFSHPRNIGVKAIIIREGDELLAARLVNEDSELLFATKYGKVVRFKSSIIRNMGRTSSGVKALKLNHPSEPGNEVIEMLAVDNPNDTILVVSENGYGKRSPLEDYRQTGRGALGVRTINITEKTGKLVAITNVTDEHDLMIITRSGITIRVRVADVREYGRYAQGVKLIDLRKNDSIASITKVESDPDIPAEPVEEGESGVGEEAPSAAPEATVETTENVAAPEMADVQTNDANNPSEES